MDDRGQAVSKAAEVWRSPRDFACTVFSVVLAVAIGWLDLHAAEVSITILALLIAGIFLGSFRPAAAWRWAILVSLGLPAMTTIARVFGLQTSEPARLDLRIMLAAFLFTLAGTYAGVFVRRAAVRQTIRTQ